MFTGIIEHVGVVRSVRPTAAGKALTIDAGPLAQDLAPGASLAVQGTCLTATRIEPPLVQFDIVTQTLSTTTLGELRAGMQVNLERALRLGGALDGHLVQGHVDGTAEVRTVQIGGQWLVEFAAGLELTEAMVAKGSVAIDGVSLTLADVAAGRFTVALVPTTLARTTLAGLAAGSKVNIETDIIGKYVHKYLQPAGTYSSGGLTMEMLRESGFA